ncbi:hypothetical protein H6G41_24350 [Tolypothrix sp. FACHB-123]|uniref:heterocyst-inhibiting protein PatX n=1 Tax=Tolypothrix sp. FACHB-123 TaxID=2692868 RepID=UPI001682D785|nr:hypothetical protein [Tolypothrix sp. FACHB-123]MBD2357704.1 hypothetical protein [Tolypothrix sp. FACHB-123]
MRALVSLLASSLVTATLIFSYQAMVNLMSDMLMVSATTPTLLSARPKTKPNQPEKPAPHRGSGRRELMEYYGNVRSTV